MRSHLMVGAIAGALLVVHTAAAAGQQPPPIDGVTGTVAPQDARQKTSEGVNTIVVKTVDGLEHLFHLTGRSAAHGLTETAEQALRGVEEGSRVVVHETMKADEKAARDADDVLKETKGVITHVDRRAKTLVIRLADGTRQTFRLTDRATSDAGKDVDGAVIRASNIVISFTDEAGRHAAHYCTRVS